MFKSLFIHRYKQVLIEMFCYCLQFHQIPQLTMMDEQILGAEQDFEMSTQNLSTDPKQRHFNKVIMELQQVILDEEFQSTQTYFMKQNCDWESRSATQVQQLFNQYRGSISQLLKQKITTRVPDFDLVAFASQIRSRQGQVDEQIAEIVLSCVDFECFKALLSDYKVAQEEEERYKVLTVKTNKLPQNKKVKGNSENIFGTSNVPNFGGKTSAKKVNSKITEKTLEQVLVPETILTVKGLRKC